MRRRTAPARASEVNLDNLALFATLAEEGSFTRAARRLQLNKATVSRRLVALEASVGARLLERNSRKVRLTEAGQPFFRRASRILEEARDLARSMSEASGAPRGLLRVTATDAIAQRLLVPVASDYLRRHPESRVQIVATQERLDILGEGMDLALRIGDLDDSAHVVRSFGAIRTGLFASPNYLRRAGPLRMPEDLASHGIIVTLEGGEARAWRLNRAGESATIHLRATLVVNSILLAREATLAGVGVARLPRFLVAEDLGVGSLEPVLPRWSTGDRGFHALFSRTDRATPVAPKVRAFLELLLTRAALLH